MMISSAPCKTDEKWQGKGDYRDKNVQEKISFIYLIQGFWNWLQASRGDPYHRVQNIIELVLLSNFYKNC